MHIQKQFFTALAALIVTVASAHAETAGPDLFTGFTRIDPENRTLVENSYIVVENGLIAAVGSGIPPGNDYRSVHDLHGKYALPGFVDAHGHITAGPHSFEIVDGAPLVTIESKAHITPYHARMALAFGVTSVRNPGGDPRANADYDRRILAGEWAGPDAVHAGAVIQGPPMGGNAFAYPQGREAWFAEAERQASLGMRYFKLYHGLTQDEIALGIEAAHENGLLAIAHLDQVSWLTAVDLGIDGLLHALPTSAELLEPGAAEAYLAERGQDARFMYQWFEYVDLDGPRVQQLIARLAERQVEVDLTLLVNEIMYSEDAMERLMPDSDLRFYHPETLEAALQFGALAHHGWTEEDFRRAGAAREKVLAFARRLYEGGVPLLIGTDGNGGGPAYALELQLHADAGLSTWEVLRLATSASARGIGFENTGRLVPGFEADIVFLNANPVDDLAEARNVHTVVTNGKAYTFEQLTAQPPITHEKEN